MALYYKVDDVARALCDLQEPLLSVFEERLKVLNKYTTHNEEFLEEDTVYYLKPCPLCGFDETVTIDYNSEHNRYYVVCDFTSGGCGCSGGYRARRSEAVRNWNSRV